MLTVQAVFKELFPLYPPPFVTQPSHIPFLHTYIPHPSTIQVNRDGIKAKLQSLPISCLSFIEAGSSTGRRVCLGRGVNPLGHVIQER